MTNGSLNTQSRTQQGGFYAHCEASYSVFVMTRLSLDQAAEIIDGAFAKGREIGRLVGPAEWASKDALALIKAAIGTGAIVN